MSNKRLVFILMVLCSVLFCACGKQDAEETVDNRQQILMKVSWSYGYSDVAELAKDSELIALIHVDALSEKTSGRPSIFNVTVLQGIYGCEEEQKLEISMMGGSNDKTVWIVEEDPLMEPGQEFLIFAKAGEDGAYYITGGPQGRFLYEDGNVTALQYTHLPQKAGIGLEVEDMALEDVIAEIEAAIE